MILDQLKNWKNYFSNPIWKTIFDELSALHEKTSEGNREIAGGDIILKVFSYTTIDPLDEQAYPESHLKYLDIHTSIAGTEKIDWYPATSLVAAKPYNAVEDEIAYLRPQESQAGILMPRGLFALFGPEDAHRPGLHPASGPEQVKKAVMKVHVDIAF